MYNLTTENAINIIDKLNKINDNFIKHNPQFKKDTSNFPETVDEIEYY